MRFWQATPSKICRLTRWDGASSWATSNPPADLVQSIRDEVGRLNQRALVRDDMTVDVTVNGGEPRGYASVARCRNGQRGGFLIVPPSRVRLPEERGRSGLVTLQVLGHWDLLVAKDVVHCLLGLGCYHRDCPLVRFQNLAPAREVGGPPASRPCRERSVGQHEGKGNGERTTGLAAAGGLLILIDVALGLGRSCPVCHGDRSSLVGAELNHLQGKGGARARTSCACGRACRPRPEA
jgi:hypothetical protein